jgi:hypothetical protein
MYGNASGIPRCFKPCYKKCMGIIRKARGFNPLVLIPIIKKCMGMHPVYRVVLNHVIKKMYEGFIRIARGFNPGKK